MIEGLFSWQVLYCRQAWFYLSKPSHFASHDNSFRYFVEIQMPLSLCGWTCSWSYQVYFVCKRLITKCPTKEAICFLVKKKKEEKKTESITADLRFVVTVVSTGDWQIDVFIAFGLICLLLHILCAKTFASSENTNSGRSNCLSYLHTTFFNHIDKFTCPVEINCLFTGCGSMIRGYKIETTTVRPSTTYKFQYCSCPYNLWEEINAWHL